MSLTIDLCFVLISTTLAGTILMVCWCAIAKILEKVGKPGYILGTFQMIHLFFLVPVSMLSLLWMRYKDQYHFTYFLRSTKGTVIVSHVLLAGWVIGLGFGIAGEVKKVRKQKKFCESLFFCEMEKQKIFSEMCNRLGIREGRVQLWQSYGTEIPFLMGLFEPRVVIPVEKYSEQQLRIIFTHELCHFRQKDLWVKVVNHLVRCIHFFNPAVKLLTKCISLWSEFSCDCKAVEALGFTKEYFDTISDMVTSDDPMDMLISGLFEKEPEIQWRVRHMLHYNKGKDLPPWKAVPLCAFTVAVGGLMISRATIGVEDLLLAAYYGTENASEEALEIRNDTEKHMTLNPDMEGKVEELNIGAKGSGTYHFTIPANSYVVTKPFLITVDSVVTISGLTEPMDTQLCVGIGKVSEDISYINARGSFSYEFMLNAEAYYYIYIENQNFNVIDVAGGYQCCFWDD